MLTGEDEIFLINCFPVKHDQRLPQGCESLRNTNRSETSIPSNREKNMAPSKKELKEAENRAIKALSKALPEILDTWPLHECSGATVFGGTNGLRSHRRPERRWIYGSGSPVFRHSGFRNQERQGCGNPLGLISVSFLRKVLPAGDGGILNRCFSSAGERFPFAPENGLSALNLLRRIAP